MQQVGLLGTIHDLSGREEVKDFDGPQVLAPEQALRWLRDKLPNLIDRSNARRREVSEPLFELARQALWVVAVTLLVRAVIALAARRVIVQGG